MKRIYIAGMGGMVGSALEPFLKGKGYEVIRFADTVDGAFVVINLAGENIGRGFWTKKKKEKIHQSRVETTKRLVRMMEMADKPPNIFISASAVGFYGANAEEVNSEDCESGEDFLAKVCKDWEREANRYSKGRVVIARLGVVIAKTGGLLQKLSKIARFGLLGRFGSGEQKTSWIAIDDLLEIIHYCITDNHITGAVNVTTVHPFSNKKCVELVTKSVGRLKFFPIPAIFIRWILGEKGTQLVLVDQSVYPKKLLESGYHFKFSHLSEVV